jgi:hypothetical protein
VRRKGCDFGMMLGDNFYDSGVDGVDDPQWQEKFELPYDRHPVPDLRRARQPRLRRQRHRRRLRHLEARLPGRLHPVSEIWSMPDKYYSFKEQHAEFWGLDTNQVMTDPLNGNSDPQKNWLIAGLAASTATWKIAFGHHPYISNGDHGNAGAYENLEGIPLPFVTGENVKEFMDDAVCGKVDIYLCGHDHNIQWLEPKCGTEFIVSGAGSKSEGLPGQNPAYFGMPETEGFIWIELKDNSFTGTFYDSSKCTRPRRVHPRGAGLTHLHLRHGKLGRARSTAPRSLVGSRAHLVEVVVVEHRVQRRPRAAMSAKSTIHPLRRRPARARTCARRAGAHTCARRHVRPVAASKRTP